MNAPALPAELIAERQVHPGWRLAAPVLLLALVAVAALLWPGLKSMVQVWDRSGTYTHGFLILPITLFLLWRNREEWLPLAPRPLWQMLPLIVAIGAAWYLGAIADVAGIQHATVVFTLIAVTAFVVGAPVLKVWLFPLAYLVFAIPFGEALLPPLMAFTADFTVMALQLVGLPVYREGLFFSVPSGNWSVVEACSGLRYLIASLALGTLYAYLSYRSLKKRMLFIAVSAIVPIAANGVRAFMIVMLGHLSNMKLAVGIDHYIYGGVFFAVVTFLLFLIGNRWRDDMEPGPATVPANASATQSTTRAGWMLALAAVVAAVAVGPVAANWTERSLRQNDARADFSGWDDWVGPAHEFSVFKPHFLGERQSYSRQTTVEGRPVGLYAAFYANQDAEHKLISSTNKIVTTRPKGWGVVTAAERRVGAQGLPVIESEIKGPGARLLAWHWYRVCGETTTSELRAKWLQLRCMATQQRDDAAVIALYTPLAEDAAQARAAMERLIAGHVDRMHAAFERPRSAQ